LRSVPPPPWTSRTRRCRFRRSGRIDRPPGASIGPTPPAPARASLRARPSRGCESGEMAARKRVERRSCSTLASTGRPSDSTKLLILLAQRWPVTTMPPVGEPDLKLNQRAAEILAAVLDVRREDRDLVLRSWCGDDVALRREVDELLSFHDSGAGPLDRSPI